MRFPVQGNVRVTDIRPITTKTGREMTFVCIANKDTYEVLETKLELAEGQSMDAIVIGCDYTAVVEYDGQWGSVTLTPVSVATKS